VLLYLAGKISTGFSSVGVIGIWLTAESTERTVLNDQRFKAMVAVIDIVSFHTWFEKSSESAAAQFLTDYYEWIIDRLRQAAGNNQIHPSELDFSCQRSGDRVILVLRVDPASAAAGRTGRALRECAKALNEEFAGFVARGEDGARTVYAGLQRLQLNAVVTVGDVQALTFENGTRACFGKPILRAVALLPLLREFPDGTAAAEPEAVDDGDRQTYYDSTLPDSEWRLTRPPPKRAG
jgi:hypothetical protein